MKFDKSKILTCVTADQAKVGDIGWFGDTLPFLKGRVGNEEPMRLGQIVGEAQYHRFVTYMNSAYALFYPASYEYLQAQWVKENNVKAGTKVRVTRTFTEDEDGSCCWEHDDLVGMTGVVGDYGIAHHSLGIDMSDGSFIAIPYFALEVIKEPTYRPFHDDELNDLVGKVVVQNHTGNAMLIIRVGDSETGKVVSLGGSQKRNARQLLDGWTFKGGHPCGVKEEL